MTESIKELISQGEGPKIEFKTRLVHERQIAVVLTAFANTEGGYLFIGVSENSEILGLSDEESFRVRERLSRICKSLFSFKYQVDIIQINDRKIVYAQIDKAPEHLAPISTGEGKIYKRVGDNIRPQQTRAFSLKTENTKKIKGFVAMSFRIEEEPALIDYFNAMLRAASNTGLPIELIRMDLEEGDYEISQEIMNKIKDSDFLIADFTLNSHNVYFEAGFARGRELSIIQTTRKDTELQFDVRNWKTLFYRNATELEEKLISRLKKVYIDLNK
jgi:predicted HTH transcriptional regulator